MEADLGYEKLQDAATAIASLSGRDKHDAALVLGSGLGDYRKLAAHWRYVLG